MNHQLQADSIQLQFGNRMVLSDIYLKIETGKITGLLGRNGAGKSCLMKVIYGYLACEKSVRINGVYEPNAGFDPKKLMYLPQHNFIPKSLTIKRIFDDFQLNFEDFSTDFPEITINCHKPLSHLSGGAIRLIELYCILKSQTQFVMLDEPFSHISPIQVDKIKQIIMHEKSNKGILISDHLYKHIIEITDDLFVLVNGKCHLLKDKKDIGNYGYVNGNDGY